MACSEVPIQTILGTECIGDSLPKIMGNFNTLGDATCDLITNVAALSSYTDNLLSLLQSVSAALTTTTNTLSTNMQNIGNYPYLEYAWVTAPNTAGQTVTGQSETVLNLTAELQDTHGYGSIATNQITLAAGIYRFEANVPVELPSGAEALVSVKTSSGVYLARKRYTGGWRHQSDSYYTTYPPYFLDDFYGQFTLSANSNITLNLLVSYTSVVGCGATNPFDGSATVIKFTSTTSTQDQRTTIKLWKVG